MLEKASQGHWAQDVLFRIGEQLLGYECFSTSSDWLTACQRLSFDQQYGSLEHTSVFHLLPDLVRLRDIDDRSKVCRFRGWVTQLVSLKTYQIIYNAPDRPEELLPLQSPPLSQRTHHTWIRGRKFATRMSLTTPSRMFVKSLTSIAQQLWPELKNAPIKGLSMVRK